MPELKVITFDLDNTLWDVDSVIVRADARMRDWLHGRIPDFAERFPAAAMLELRSRVVSENPAWRHDLSKLREEILFLAIRECGHDETLSRSHAQEAFAIFLDARHEVEFFEGALETLATLSERFVLGALTNGNAEFQRLGLDRYFSFGFSSASVGASKPAPDIFHAALRHSGIRADQAVHVGDHLVDDIQGATAVGMHAIWVNHHAAPLPEDGATPSEIVHHLRELPEGIGRILKPR
jgi:putative hydrolase of the HAD superfamily